jgi:hypothetical protein
MAGFQHVDALDSLFQTALNINELRTEDLDARENWMPTSYKQI